MSNVVLLDSEQSSEQVVADSKKELADVQPLQRTEIVVTEEATGFSFQEDVSPYLGLFSLIFVIVGWKVIYRNAKKLATRTESKSFIEDTTKILSEIETLAVEYWLAGRKSRMETEQYVLIINAKLLTLNSRLNILESRAIDTSVVDLSQILEFTTLECENVDRIKDSQKRERVQSLLDEINTAHVKLYSQYQEVYKPTFSFKRRFSFS
ncbi:hypothetical protein M2G96_07585 [Vibrio vulnificus]|nr:hypothetical protein [Vibrio vulnificus]MCU8112933.1 hypothetical protein [Vibrio vulnificus]MCU8214107.1 hypothetical protein [Vibrio vulnificus]MCU8305437.1 hypothetical protein [Vibrio vulnificus]